MVSIMYDAFASARLRPLHDLDPRLFQLSFGQPVSYSIRGIGRAREEARIGSTKRCRNGFETAGAMANWMAGFHGPPVGRHQPSCLSQAPSIPLFIVRFVQGCYPPKLPELHDGSLLLEVAYGSIGPPPVVAALFVSCHHFWL